MKKFLIIFSSQNGSTQKVAETIQESLIKGGHQADIRNTKTTEKIDVNKYDFIGIGCPTYYFRPSYEMMGYLDSLVDLKSKRIFTFVTYGSEIGDGANWLRKKMKKMGAVDIGHISCPGRHMFPGYTSRGYLFSPNSPSTDELETVRSFTKDLINKIELDKFGLPASYDRRTHPVMRFERLVTTKFLIKYLYSAFFKASKTQCDLCGICIDVCPTSNIALENDQPPVWGRKCIMCCSCQIQCPHQAVQTPLSWYIFAPFLRYNVIRTKNKKIPYIKNKN